MRHLTTLLGLAAALAISGCGSSDDETSNDGAGAVDGPMGVDDHETGTHPGGGHEPTDDCPVVVSDAECDTSLPPIVFVHGTFGSASEISNTARLFGSNGYCQDRIVAIEYNSLGEAPIQQISDLVDRVLTDTEGHDQVVLAAHSQGTIHACSYLAEPGATDKVSKYINISGGCDGAGVPSMSLSSENDLYGGPVHPGNDVGQEKITLEIEDHVALAGSRLSFMEMYKYVTGEDPEHTSVQCGTETVTVSGLMVTLGDNEPRAGGRLEIYEVDELADTPWERGEPAQTIVADDRGRVSMKLRRDVAYEFRQVDADGTRLGSTYRAPLKRSDYLARFLSESSNGIVYSATVEIIRRSGDYTVVAGRYLAGVFRKDWGNSLVIDGEEILDDTNASRSGNVTGLFMHDANANGATDRGVVENVSFLYHTDVFIDASTPRWLDVQWTNEEGGTANLKIPNWPADREFVQLYLPYP